MLGWRRATSCFETTSSILTPANTHASGTTAGTQDARFVPACVPESETNRGESACALFASKPRRNDVQRAGRGTRPRVYGPLFVIFPKTEPATLAISIGEELYQRLVRNARPQWLEIARLRSFECIRRLIDDLLHVFRERCLIAKTSGQHSYAVRPGRTESKLCHRGV